MEIIEEKGIRRHIGCKMGGAFIPKRKKAFMKKKGNYQISKGVF